MSAGPAYAPDASAADTPRIASSAVVIGTARFGAETLLAERENPGHYAGRVFRHPQVPNFSHRALALSLP
jgi:hypothetical protein